MPPSAKAQAAPTSESWWQGWQGAANPSPTHDMADEPRKLQNPVCVESGGR